MSKADDCTCQPGAECVACIKREIRACERRRHIRQQAPTILAGLIASTNGEKSLGRVRELAIEQAGLIFDETEEA